LLPSINSWFQDVDDHSDSELGHEDDDILCDEQEDEETEDYQSLLDTLENMALATSQENDRLMGYRYARIALSMDDQMKM
jgi:hypothetical protein